MYKIYQLIYKKIQQKLNSYIKGGEIEEKTSLQRVEITLSNVKIKKSALSTLQLPFVIHNSSKVKKIQISISNHPKLKIQIENLHIVINPSILRHLNQQHLQDIKSTKLKDWEEKQKNSLKSSGYSKKIMEWILPNLLSRVKVHLKNFTILYQDTESLQILGYPCLCIIKFNEIKIWRTNSNWTKGSDKDIKDIFVRIDIKELSVTLRCDPLDFEKGNNIDSFYDEMRASERNYMLRPVSMKIKVSLNINTIQKTIINEIKAEVAEDIQIAINEYQRSFIEGLMNYIDSSIVLKRYAFLKPKSSIKSSPGDWWKYLISAAKYDNRYNILSILKTHSIKEKYIEYYKRTQEVIQVPVLLKLSPSELKHMKEIEEIYQYKELVVFRTQALDQLRKKISQEKKNHSNKHEDENVKKYLSDYYSEVINELKIEEEAKDEDSEDSDRIIENQIKINLSLSIPRIVFSVQVLNIAGDPKFIMLDNTDCECSRCQVSKSIKNNLSPSITYKKQIPGVPLEAGEIRNTDYKIRGPLRNSLLPTRKMRDIAIEYGEEIYNIGPICYKNHSGEPYEHNIMKERTLMILIIDNILVSVSGLKEYISLDLSVSNIVSLDPFSFIFKGFNYNYTEKVRDLNDLLNYEGWFGYLFKEPDENKPLWALRHFMRDLDALPEFEFLMHYYELQTGKDICVCGVNMKNERTIQKEFILSNKSIHICKDIKEDILRRWEIENVKAIALKIEKKLAEVFPSYLRASLRYFIASLMPRNQKPSPGQVIIKIAKDKQIESEKPKYVSLIEVSLSRIPFYINANTIPIVNAFITPQVQLGIFPKPFQKPTFLSTLEDLPDKLLTIRSILNNWDRSKYMLLCETRYRVQRIPLFTLELKVDAVEVCLISTAGLDKLKEIPVLTLFFNDIRVLKDSSSNLSELECDGRTESIHNLEVLPEHFFQLKIFIDDVSVQTTSEILKTSVAILININPFSNHPTIPNNLIDVHIPAITATINANIFPLITILNTIDTPPTYTQKKNALGIIRIMDNEFINEYKAYIYNLDIRNYSKNMAKYAHEHSRTPDRCRHCLFKYLKTLSYINLTVGNMSDDDVEGFNLSIDIDGQKVFEVACKNAMCSVEEKFFSSKITLSLADIIGSNRAGESLRIHPGKEHIGIQPYLPIRFQHIFKLTTDLYYKSCEVLSYTLLTVKQLKNSEIVNEDQWNKFDNQPESKKNSLNMPKAKLNDIMINENEFKADLVIDHVALTMCFLPSSMLLKGLVMIDKCISLAKAVVNSPVKDTFTVKHLARKVRIELKFISVFIELGHIVLETNLKDFELSILPISSIPTIQQVNYNKNKETETIFSQYLQLRVLSVTIEIPDLFKFISNDIKFELNSEKDSKIKVIDKVLTGFIINKITKLNGSLNFVQVLTDGELVLAVPAEVSRGSLIISKTKNSIKIMGDVKEVYVVVPHVGVMLEVQNMQKILSNLIEIPDIKIDKYDDFDTYFLLKPLETVAKLSNNRLVIYVTHLFLNLSYSANLIFQLKLHNIYLHYNMPKGILEKYLNIPLKESLDIQDNIYSDSDTLSIILKKIELLPMESVHDHMIEMSSDYSLFIHINTLLKKITIFNKSSIKIIVINKVLEEFLLSIKSIKSLIPKKKDKSTPGYTVECNLNGGEASIPKSSLDADLVKVIFNKCTIGVCMGDRELYKPTPINENTTVIKMKKVLHDEYEHKNFISCDLVSVVITNVNAETFINQKTKKIAKLGEIILDISVPASNEELEEFQWKIDSFVNISFRDAEIKTSLVI